VPLASDPNRLAAPLELKVINHGDLSAAKEGSR
jgi:hypothetical protein